MDKKVLLFVFFSVFLFVAVSLTSAIGYGDNGDKKKSPLYDVRTNMAFNEKTSYQDDIKSRFVRERIFILPLQGFLSFNRFSDKENVMLKTGMGRVPTTCILRCLPNKIPLK